ncbi:MAG: ribonuclease Z [Candidatus Thorarchaeota archaeon]
MSTMRIVFLGTSAAVPQKNRFLTSISMQRDKGEILLFDCGEGTQYQLLKYNVNFQKITKIFISHLHGDHIFGIFGLLQTMKLMERESPLKIFGPPGFKNFFESIFGSTANYGSRFPIEVIEIMEGLILEEPDYYIYGKSTLHSVYTLSYAYIEKDRMGKFDKEKATALKVKRGKKWQTIQEGKSVLSEDNKVITPEMILGPKRRGFKIIFASDGLYQEDFISFVCNADILIMEATFSDEQEEKAKEKLHSTARWSAKIASKANVKRLYLTHISARSKDNYVLEKEAKEEFPEAMIAYDGLEIKLNRKDLEKEEEEEKLREGTN